MDDDKLDLETKKFWRQLLREISYTAEKKVCEEKGIKFISDIRDNFDRREVEEAIERKREEMLESLSKNLAVLCVIAPFDS